jgi:hypothetical protein
MPPCCIDCSDSIPGGTMIVTDDIYSIKDLSYQQDIDGRFKSALFLRWNFVPQSMYKEYHVYVSVDDQPFKFLGQTDKADINHFRWCNASLYRTNDLFEEGPQSGCTYRFKAAGLRIDGGIDWLETGPVSFLESETVVSN